MSTKEKSAEKVTEVTLASLFNSEEDFSKTVNELEEKIIRINSIGLDGKNLPRLKSICKVIGTEAFRLYIHEMMKTAVKVPANITEVIDFIESGDCEIISPNFMRFANINYWRKQLEKGNILQNESNTACNVARRKVFESFTTTLLLFLSTVRNDFIAVNSPCQSSILWRLDTEKSSISFEEMVDFIAANSKMAKVKLMKLELKDIKKRYKQIKSDLDLMSDETDADEADADE